MASPKISIITPVWNGMPHLKECVNSAISQEFKNWEMLISDDGSHDGSREYLDTLKDPRIRIFRQEHNLGIFGNLNFLFSQAKAPLSQILCQDDYFAGPYSLHTIMGYWKNAAPATGFVRFNHMQEPSRQLTIDLQQRMAPPVITPEHASLWFFVFGNIPGNLSNVSLRTRVIDELGGFNQNFPFAGDFEFWVRASRRFSMGVEKELVAHVRRHEKVASNFLSLHGELYHQHLSIYEQLIEDLSPSFCRKKLVKYFNFEIGSFHYRTGIREALNGSFAYLKGFATTRTPITWPAWRRLIACLHLALFEKTRMRSTVKMASEFLTL